MWLCVGCVCATGRKGKPPLCGWCSKSGCHGEVGREPGTTTRVPDEHGRCGCRAAEPEEVDAS